MGTENFMVVTHLGFEKREREKESALGDTILTLYRNVITSVGV